MLVAVQVSSMKTSRSGSRSTCPSNRFRRCFKMSGRSCLIAWPAFFCASCPGAQRCDTTQQPRRSDRSRPALRAIPQARCPCAPPNSKGLCRMLFHPTRTHVAALWLGSKVTRFPSLRFPADRRRWRNAEPHRRSSARRQKSRAQIHRKGVSHPCQPPSPARILNHKSRPTGSPTRFKTVENRSS